MKLIHAVNFVESAVVEMKQNMEQEEPYKPHMQQ
jgi:hypothetical protein